MNATPLSQIAAWAGGRLVGGNPAQTITDVTSDSRSLKPGDLFVAIRGGNFDGHDFLADAARLGAAGAIVAGEIAGLPSAFALIVVADTVCGLQSLASAHRAALRLTSVCITGSTGKTSTKDLCGSVFAQRLCKLLPRLQTKAEMQKEPRLACTVTMRRVEQIIRDLLSLDHQLVCVG